MIDYYYVLEALYRQRLAVVLMVLLSISAGMIASRLRRHLSRAALWLPALGLTVHLIRAFPLEYHLVSLSGEDDRQAEDSFVWLSDFLSDTKLALRLQKADDANEQYYLALIAARRNLALPKDVSISKPSFMHTNRFNPFAWELRYPVTYTDFRVRYICFQRQISGTQAGDSLPQAWTQR